MRKAISSLVRECSLAQGCKCACRIARVCLLSSTWVEPVAYMPAMSTFGPEVPTRGTRRSLAFCCRRVFARFFVSLFFYLRSIRLIEGVTFLPGGGIVWAVRTPISVRYITQVASVFVTACGLPPHLGEWRKLQIGLLRDVSPKKTKQKITSAASDVNVITARLIGAMVCQFFKTGWHLWIAMLIFCTIKLQLVFRCENRWFKKLEPEVWTLA